MGKVQNLCIYFSHELIKFFPWQKRPAIQIIFIFYFESSYRVYTFIDHVTSKFLLQLITFLNTHVYITPLHTSLLKFHLMYTALN